MKNKYNRVDDSLINEKGFGFLKEKPGNNVFDGWPDITLSEMENQSLIARLKKIGIDVQNFRIVKQEYLDYLEKVNYKKKYPGYYPGNFHEKTLEHFIAFKLLKPTLSNGRNFIDIGAEKSPHNKIFGQLTGCKGYKQDIRFLKGVWWRRIGSNASHIPVEDNFFHAALAACSIEHFEKDADIGFMKEMLRILTINGIVVVVPLYLHKKAFCVTDPGCFIPGKVTFDPGVDIHCVNGWRNRHGRFYSPETLVERLIKPLRHQMNFTIYYIENFKEIHNSVYCRFALVGEKVH